MTLGKYRIGSRLGSGGFGVVYLGTSLKDKKQYAVKILEATDDQDALRRFKREVRIQSQLKHPNIVPILDFDVEADPPWFAMPLAEGNLRQRLSHLTSEEEAVSIFRQIISGVQYAHREGVIHRDLKPENVLFMGAEKISISDFGLGRRLTRDTTTITRTNMGIGTLEYMAPEQYVRPKEADKRSDIFALGKILYEMLTKRLPYPSVEPELLIGKFQYVVGRCVRNNPDERFQSVRQLASELDLLQKPEEFEEPYERARRILDDLLKLAPDKKKNLAHLDDILQREKNNPVCYEVVLPRIPAPLLMAYAEANEAAFKEIVRQYDAYVSGPLDFEYTDLVADFYRTCFGIVDDLDIRRVLLARLLDMGYRHNRFHVRDVFWRLVSSVKDPGLAMTTVETVCGNPEAAEWMAERIGSYQLLPIIKKAFDKVMKDRP
jgi:serine/threonine protein kinase